MKSGGAPKRRAYDRTKRLEEAQKTRAAIVDAARRLLRKVPASELALADVAARAEVSVRTVYRHFPSPAELVQAVAQDFAAKVLPVGQVTERLSEVPDQLGKLQRALSEDPSLYPLFFALPARSGAELGKRVQAWAAEVSEKVPAAQRPALNGIVELLASPYAWDVLHSHWQLRPEQITRACIAAIQSVLDGFARHPEWLDPAAPLPPRFASTSPRRRKTPR